MDKNINKSSLDPNKIYVSGPVNIIRLEGTVNNVKKVLYASVEYHWHDMMKCDNIFSRDITKYLADSFLELNSVKNKTYDFFLEHFPSELSNIKYGYHFEINSNYQEMYIRELRKFFNKIFSYDAEKHKVKTSEIFKNVRFHYLDIRDYFGHEHLFYDRIREIYRILDNMQINGINLSALDRIIMLLTQCIGNYKYMFDTYKNIDKPLDKTDIKLIQTADTKRNNEDKYDPKYTTYILDKLIYRYHYDNIKNLINKYLKENFDQIEGKIKVIEETIKFCQSFSKLYDETKDKLIEYSHGNFGYYYGMEYEKQKEFVIDLIKKIIPINAEFIAFYVKIVDLYFLRRFLDKDYITNAISYTGGMHTYFYIHFLIKEFGFKITHVSYSSITDLNKLESEIKSIDSFIKLAGFFLPPERSQCTDMTNFPKNFL